jgi:hypothetical protein
MADNKIEEQRVRVSMRIPVTILVAAFAFAAGCDGTQPLEPGVPDTRVATARSSTGADVVAPSEAVATAVSNSAIRIGWRDNSTGETRFEIHRSVTGAAGTFSLLASPGANIVTHVDEGLTTGAEYCYRVRAVILKGRKTSTSGFSDTACASLAANVPIIAIPTGVAAVTLSATSIEVSWNDNSTGESGQWLFRSNPADPGSMTVIATLAENVESYVDAGLHAATEYCYRVKATGSWPQISDFSNTACASTAGPAPSVPAPVTDVRAVPFANAIKVTWTDNATNEIAHRVYSSIGGGAWVLRSTQAGTLFADGESQLEQSACYRITAFNSGGESVPSSPVCTARVAAPSNFAAVDVEGAHQLTWSDNSSVEDGYQVIRYMSYCYPDPFSSGRQEGDYVAATLPANTTSYVLEALPEDPCAVLMNVFVIAIKDGGDSYYSWPY